MERSAELSMDQIFLQKLTATVFANMNNDQFGARDLAKEVGLSRSQIHRKLQKINGKSITQFIREIRLDEALKLLQREVGTSSEISFNVGFSSPAYFTKCFHAYFGFPPEEVKKKKEITPEKEAAALQTEKTTIIPLYASGSQSIRELERDLEEGDRRKLTTIMFTDISGFTAIMGESERKALNLLKVNLKLHLSLIDLYNGNILKEIGDAILASFDSPCDAVHYAQQIMQVSKEEDELKLHIGIHLGEVYFKDGDIYGDGVNIASRINTSAKEGEVLISEDVWKNVKNKENIYTEFIDEKQFKNVKEPVKIFKVVEKNHSNERAQESLSVWSKIKSISRWRWAAIVLISGLLIIGTINLYEHSIVNTIDPPSIAILSFENTGNDQKFDYLEKGLADGIITNLMSVHSLQVISDRASFQFTGPNKSYVDISRELNVDHILEGSLLVMEEMVTLTIRFVDAETGQIWKIEPFEENIESLNKLQGNAAMGIIDAFEIELVEEEMERISTDDNFNITAYEYMQKGRNILRIKNDWSSLQESKQFFYLSVQSDPTYLDGYVGLAEVAWREVGGGYEPGIEGLLEVKEFVKKANNIDPNRAEVFTLTGLIEMYNNNWDRARVLFEKSIESNPNYPFTYLCRAWTFSAKKEHNEAIKAIDNAILLDPTNLYYQQWKVFFLCFAGYFDRAESISSLYFEIDSLRDDIYYWRGFSLIEQKEYEDASLYLEIRPWWCSWKGYCFGMTGDNLEAMAFLNNLLNISHNNYMPPANIGILYIGLNELDSALKYLEKAYEVKDNRGVFLVNSTIFDPLRDDPRFQELLVKMGLAE